MAMNVKHPDWKAFVDQMRLNRADMLPRKVFSDWCEDTFGEQPFAKFVRLSCAIAEDDPNNLLAPVRGWDVPRRPGMHPDWERYYECEKLLRQSWETWPPLNKLDQGIRRQWRFHGGYPDRLVMPFATWMKHYRELLAIGPVGSVHLYDSPGCHDFIGRQFVTFVPANMDLIHLCAASKIDHEVLFERSMNVLGRVRFSNGLPHRLIEEQAIEVVLNRVWKSPLVAAIYIDEPRGDSPQEYADR